MRRPVAMKPSVVPVVSLNESGFRAGVEVRVEGRPCVPEVILVLRREEYVTYAERPSEALREVHVPE